MLIIQGARVTSGKLIFCMRREAPRRKREKEREADVDKEGEGGRELVSVLCMTENGQNTVPQSLHLRTGAGTTKGSQGPSGSSAHRW